MNELYAGTFARCYGFDSIGLRYFNVFGPRQDPNGAYAAVIPKWIAGMIRNEPVHINGDGETARDFCHVDNVVQANLLAALADDPAAVNQVYNVALGERTSLNELFGLIRALLKPRYPHLRDFRPIYREFRPGDVRFSQADISKEKGLLGYRPLRVVRMERWERRVFDDRGRSGHVHLYGDLGRMARDAWPRQWHRSRVHGWSLCIGRRHVREVVRRPRARLHCEGAHSAILRKYAKPDSVLSVADDLDVVTVGVEHERAVIVGMIVRA